MLTILFDGVAYGMLLFVLACGLSVTLGLMNLINLAHGAFAMAGGYVTVVLVNRMGVPFLAALPLAFLVTAAIGALLERTLYVHVYAKSHLDQVLFTIGLVFMAVAAVDYTMGSSQQFVKIPQMLQGQVDVFGIGVGKYRLLIIVVCGLLTLALQLALTKTRFGSRLRAAVDDQRVARGLGINVNAVFARYVCRGLGPRRTRRRARCGNPGSRPDLSAQVHDLFPDRGDRRRHFQHHGPVPRLDPCWASVTSRASITQPKLGGFAIYTIMIVVLIWRPQGAVLAPDVALGGWRCRSRFPPRLRAGSRAPARWTPLEVAFWLLAAASIYFLPNRHLILTEIAILALFALSLDLILGYAGILSLGHAAFFGFGGYAAGLLAKHALVTEPILAWCSPALLLRSWASRPAFSCSAGPT